MTERMDLSQKERYDIVAYRTRCCGFAIRNKLQPGFAIPNS